MCHRIARFSGFTWAGSGGFAGRLEPTLGAARKRDARSKEAKRIADARRAASSCMRGPPDSLICLPPGPETKVGKAGDSGVPGFLVLVLPGRPAAFRLHPEVRECRGDDREERSHATEHLYRDARRCGRGGRLG